MLPLTGGQCWAMLRIDRSEARAVVGRVEAGTPSYRMCEMMQVAPESS